MKLRIRSNTLRFRLRQDEVVRLANGGAVEECVRFGPDPSDAFFYRIEPSEAVEEIGLRYEPGRITALLSRSICSLLSEPEEVGLERTLPGGTEEGIAVLIEKDFVCRKPRNPKEDVGSFPHP